MPRWCNGNIVDYESTVVSSSLTCGIFSVCFDSLVVKCAPVTRKSRVRFSIKTVYGFNDFDIL